jgi:ribosomal protein L11 methyltransferase
VIRLALRVRRRDAELVLADLLELAPSGVEEVELAGGDGGEGTVEYAVYGAPGELPLLPDLRAAAGGALVDISTSELADDWSERWKQFHRPVLIEAHPAAIEAHPADAPRVRAGHRFFVRPPWEPPSDLADALDIAIDPAQAFGTGAHATTRLCLELLLELAAERGVRAPVLDVGAGSGVLAIAAAKLGYRRVLALDNDRESVRAILANAAVNDVGLEARCFDLRRESLPWLVGDGDLKGVPVALGAASTVVGGGGDRTGVPVALGAASTVVGGGGDRTGVPVALGAASTVVGGEGVPVALGAPSTTVGPDGDHGQVVLANLLRPLLIDMAEKIAQPGVPAAPARLDLIASGLLREQADEVADVFARRLGLSERARRERGEWSALWLERQERPLAAR